MTYQAGGWNPFSLAPFCLVTGGHVSWDLTLQVLKVAWAPDPPVSTLSAEAGSTSH